MRIVWCGFCIQLFLCIIVVFRSRLWDKECYFQRIFRILVLVFEDEIVVQNLGTAVLGVGFGVLGCGGYFGSLFISWDILLDCSWKILEIVVLNGIYFMSF